MTVSPTKAKIVNAARREFILWLATPASERTLNTQKALAEKLGVDATTLSDWKRDPRIIQAVNEIVEKGLAQFYGDVIESLIREAIKGSYNHQKLYLEMIGKYRESITINMVRQEAQKLADEYGLDAKELMQEAERIVSEHTKR